MTSGLAPLFLYSGVLYSGLLRSGVTPIWPPLVPQPYIAFFSSPDFAGAPASMALARSSYRTDELTRELICLDSASTLPDSGTGRDHSAQSLKDLGMFQNLAAVVLRNVEEVSRRKRDQGYKKISGENTERGNGCPVAD